MYVRCVFVQYAAVCHYRRFVCVSGAPVRLRSGHRFVVGPAPARPRPTALLPPRSNGKPEAATADDKLLMMGMRMAETC